MIFVYFFFIALLFTFSQATSCGQPRLSANDKCSNWQCSRIVYPSENKNVTPDPDAYFGYGMCVRGLPEGSKCVVNDDCFINELSCEVNKSTGKKVCLKKAATKNYVLGYIGILVAVVGFGTNFIPAKYVKHTSNGVLFQFVMCCAIFIVGIVTALSMKKYTLYPMALVGGMIWCLGNLLCLPIIQLIGMGLGISTWGIASMVIGFASGKWGLMGVKKETGGIEWAQYLGVVFALISIAIISCIKPSPKRHDEMTVEGDIYTADSLIDKSSPQTIQANHIYEQDEQVRQKHSDDSDETSNSSKFLPPKRVMIGFGMAICSGLLFGMNFNPSQAQMDYYIQKTLQDPSSTPSLLYSPNGLDYVLSYTIGIFFTSTLATVFFYGAHTLLPKSVAKCLPKLFDDMHLVDFPMMIVPAFICGAVWCVANIGWFVANTNLGLSVSFPIISIGPLLLANFFGIILFREIKGKRNFLFLAAAFTTIGISIFFTVFSKK